MVFSVNTQSSSSKVHRVLKKYRSKSWTSWWYSLSLGWKLSSRFLTSQQELAVEMSRNVMLQAVLPNCMDSNLSEMGAGEPARISLGDRCQEYSGKQGFSSPLMSETLFL